MSTSTFPLVALIGFVTAFACSAIIVRFVIRLVTRARILDVPVERSSHDTPTPTGGGVGVLSAIFVVFGIAAYSTNTALSVPNVLMAFAVVLALLGWIDDVKGLSPAVRLLIQALSVAAVLVSAPAYLELTLGSGFFEAVTLFAVGIAWIWFINLYNFMDGIDGLAGVETISICIGVAMVCQIAGVAQALIIPALVIAGAAGGFLLWNWHPASIFLGDVGSVPLGFLVGWLLISLAIAGEWQAALILPAYYLADATLTLLSRVCRRRKFWLPHKEHFYQRAHQRGMRHSQVVLIILIGNIALMLNALIAASGYTVVALLGSAIITTAILYVLSASKRSYT